MECRPTIYCREEKQCSSLPRRTLRQTAFKLLAVCGAVLWPDGAAVLEAQEIWEELRSPAGRDCRPTRGTLFRWGLDDEADGGPKRDEPIVTDRPDFTEASVTVGCGVAQIEAGYTYFGDSEAGATVRSHSLAEPLLRFGVLADWLELRVAAFPVHQRTRDGSGSNGTTGIEDLYLGAKLALTPQEKWLPEMALVPQMTVPTGSNAFTNDETLPGMNWLYGWDINDKLATGGSTQVNRALDEATGRAYAEWAQSWTVDFSFTEKLGMYTEWFAFFPNAADTAKTEHYFDGGFTYLVNDDMQLDIRAGKGLNDAADDFFAGVGLSVRFQ